MPQLFSRRANTVARVSLAAGLLVLAGLVLGAGRVVRSPWATEIGVAVQQPIPFSHQHHVRDDMIDGHRDAGRGASSRRSPSSWDST